MVFVETCAFRQRLADFMDDAAFRVLQNELVANSERGEVMPGCAGLRKIRVGHEKRGKGKRGGARVIYLSIPELQRIYFVTIYGKNERDDLTEKEKKILAALASRIKAEARPRIQGEESRSNHG